MKTYETIEDWRKDWTQEKQEEYNRVFKEKYGDLSPLGERHVTRK